MKRILITLSIILVLLCSCTNNSIVPGIDENTDAITFKEEYEAYNNTFDDKRGIEYTSMEISEDNPIKYAQLEDVLAVLNGGSGVIYFGFPTCPWCRRALPYLLSQAQKTQTEQILYFNALDIRDIKELDANGNVEVIQEAGVGYYELIEALKDYAQPYDGLNDESIKRLYFPTILFVKEGEIIYANYGTTDYQDSPYDELNAQQATAYEKELRDAFMKTFRDVCDSAC